MVHMNHLTPDSLARVVRESLDRTSLSDREIERRTGISRTTLNRRLADGRNLTAGDLISIAALLDLKLSALVEAAEEVAA